MKKIEVEVNERELLLEGDFWAQIREDLIASAECECSPAFLEMVVGKINTSGPQALKRLYLAVNK